ncbi:MAG: hypothetical protein EA426_04760 [Spirochaetaceae bacterium]|nr:MAG: hypothetical protein EA426_04760 [Spirochaetaceae bacterium]
MELWIHVDFKYMPPTVESLINDIENWAAEGATGVVFEWENMFPYPGLGSAVRADAYTPGDVRLILDACRAVGLAAVPLVQTLGHLEWLLEHEEFRRFREFDEDPRQIKACDGEARAILTRKIAALLEAHYDSEYVHLGADEAYGLEKIDRSGCSSVAEGAGTVFLRHIAPLLEQVEAAGKRPIIWADMPLHHPENIAEYPQNVVFCDWLYSQTSDHASSLHDWELGRVEADRYALVPEYRRGLFEPYWSIGAREFPGEFYQFPYTPYLRDSGYDVVVGPSTLYAGNALSAQDLPNARANARGWLGAARRFGAIGALNTCWAIRGAFREVTNAGHRAFLRLGTQTEDAQDDATLSAACWRGIAGDDAPAVAKLIDGLAPPVDELSSTRPIVFDAARRTHRPRAYDERWESLRETLAALDPGDPDVEQHEAAADRGRRTAETLAAFGSEHEQLRAWELAARETALRAEVWLAAWRKARTRPHRESLDRLATEIDAQAGLIERFMTGRYMASDRELVLEDRYGSLSRLLKLMA